MECVLIGDIFIPKSSPTDALVSPLHTVTYITNDKAGVDQMFQKGYRLHPTSWVRPSAAEYALLNRYFGFASEHSWEVCAYTKQGAASNVQIRVIHLDQETDVVRPSYDGLYTGGATISFPIVDLKSHGELMQSIGVDSTVGIKEMEFVSPTGETYISAETVYKAPENIFVLGVTRPGIFVPVGPIDDNTGIGGAAYSARCVVAADTINDFLENVLGYEIRRDVAFEVGERSAINLPEGTMERFVQAFAPGSSTGYLILMDHGEATKHSPAPDFGPPCRGIGIWTFATKKLDEVYEKALNADIEIVSAPANIQSPFLESSRTLLMKDPGGFPIEVYEPRSTSSL